MIDLTTIVLSAAGLQAFKNFRLYLTLPYGEGMLPPSAEASDGPNAHPRMWGGVVWCSDW